LLDDVLNALSATSSGRAHQHSPVALDHNICRLAPAPYNLVRDLGSGSSSSRQLPMSLLGQFHDLHRNSLVPVSVSCGISASRISVSMLPRSLLHLYGLFPEIDDANGILQTSTIRAINSFKRCRSSTGTPLPLNASCTT
jgi:hypothetical protein